MPLPPSATSSPAGSPAGSLSSALAAGPVILDGGLSTLLEDRGEDISGALWSARLLRDAPEALLAAHRAFFAAGAQVATTAGYQASYPGFAQAGLDRAQAGALLTRSVQLARQAQQEVAGPSWVAASVGPYGAYLAGGQEYTGDYGDAAPADLVGQLVAFHRPRLETLAAAEPDVLALETVPCLAEVEALLLALEGLGVPAWLSLTTVTGPDGTVRTRRGEPAGEAFRMAADHPAVIAVGVNCTAPDGVAAAVRTAAAAGRPVVAYPNSGERYDAATGRWSGPAGLRGQDVRTWVAAGARLVGGCCRVTPADIARLGHAVHEPA